MNPKNEKKSSSCVEKKCEKEQKIAQEYTMSAMMSASTEYKKNDPNLVNKKAYAETIKQAISPSNMNGHQSHVDYRTCFVRKCSRQVRDTMKDTLESLRQMAPSCKSKKDRESIQTAISELTQLIQKKKITDDSYVKFSDIAFAMSDLKCARKY